jgi:nucleoside-diphosphate-sugar epimerase
MPRAPELLIAGCGDIGCRVAERLLAAGWKVHGMRRDISALPAGIEPLAGDLAQPQCPSGWPGGALDYLLYAASANRHDEAGYREAYVDGLRHVLGWLAEHGQRPRRLLFLSSTGVYGQDQGEWVDENSATEPRGYTGRTLLEAEQLARASGLPVTVVRLAGLYHPGRPWLQEQIRAGLQAQREPPQYSNRIHRDDAAGLIAHLLQADAGGKALQECYLGVDDEPAALHEVVDWMRAKLGVTQCSEQMLSRRAGSKRCSNARARTLGWAPAYPTFREGYAAITAE